MPDLRRRFCEDVAKVRADADHDTKKLMARLKRMTPAELLRQPPKTFESLTAAEYREVVATIAPDVKLPAPPQAEEFLVERRTWRDRWREQSALTRAMTLTVITTLIVVTAAILSPLTWKWLWSRMEIVRPISTATWPICTRLSPYTDGCIYYPTQNLNWAWVAQQLDMSAQDLYAANRDLPLDYIPAHSPVAVWRHRGRLEP